MLWLIWILFCSYWLLRRLRALTIVSWFFLMIFSRSEDSANYKVKISIYCWSMAVYFSCLCLSSRIYFSCKFISSDSECKLLYLYTEPWYILGLSKELTEVSVGLFLDDKKLGPQRLIWTDDGGLSFVAVFVTYGLSSISCSLFLRLGYFTPLERLVFYNFPDVTFVSSCSCKSPSLKLSCSSFDWLNFRSSSWFARDMSRSAATNSVWLCEGDS